MVNQSAEREVVTTCTTQSLGKFLIEGHFKEQSIKVKPVYIYLPGKKMEGERGGEKKREEKGRRKKRNVRRGKKPKKERWKERDEK